MNQRDAGAALQSTEGGSDPASAAAAASAEQLKHTLLSQAQQLLDGVARYVAKAQPQTLLRDAEDLARREPALALGAAFLLGAAAGRLLPAVVASRAQPGASEGVQAKVSETRDYSRSAATPNFPQPNRYAAVARDIPEPSDGIGVGSPIGSDSTAGGVPDRRYPR